MQPSGNHGTLKLPELGSELVELFLQNQKKYIFFFFTGSLSLPTYQGAEIYFHALNAT